MSNHAQTDRILYTGTIFINCKSLQYLILFRILDTLIIEIADWRLYNVDATDIK